MYKPTRKAAEELGVCPNTLRNWANEGKIRYIRTASGQRRYDTSSVINPDAKPLGVCYCRVSSAKQKDDLARQIAFMREKFPDYDIVSDIGSGLNFKRKGFEAVLERAMQGTLGTLVVAHRDRLCRFGFDLAKWVVERNGGKVVVLDDVQSSPERELVTDLVSIVHVFACRIHGMRKYASQIAKDPDLPHGRAEGDHAKDDGDGEICVQPDR